MVKKTYGILDKENFGYVRSDNLSITKKMPSFFLSLPQLPLLYPVGTFNMCVYFCATISEKNNESWNEIIKLIYLKIQVKFKKGYLSY